MPQFGANPYCFWCFTSCSACLDARFVRDSAAAWLHGSLAPWLAKLCTVPPSFGLGARQKLASQPDLRMTSTSSRHPDPAGRTAEYQCMEICVILIFKKSARLKVLSQTDLGTPCIRGDPSFKSRECVASNPLTHAMPMGRMHVEITTRCVQSKLSHRSP